MHFTNFNSIFHPFAMKMVHSRIIFFIQVGYGIIYLVLAFVGSYINGLQGFCCEYSSNAN